MPGKLIQFQLPEKLLQRVEKHRAEFNTRSGTILHFLSLGLDAAEGKK